MLIFFGFHSDTQFDTQKSVRMMKCIRFLFELMKFLLRCTKCRSEFGGEKKTKPLTVRNVEILCTHMYINCWINCCYEFSLWDTFMLIMSHGEMCFPLNTSKQNKWWDSVDVWERCIQTCQRVFLKANDQLTRANDHWFAMCTLTGDRNDFVSIFSGHFSAWPHLNSVQWFHFECNF